MIRGAYQRHPRAPKQSEAELRVGAVLSDAHCSTCHGAGVQGGNHRGLCHCVRRRIFRTCYQHYRSRGLRFWSVLYRIDFELAAERKFPADEVRAFFRWAEGADWRTCAPMLDMDRGQFFHFVYRTEEVLGAELLRRGLYPPAEYRLPTAHQAKREPGDAQAEAEDTRHMAQRWKVRGYLVEGAGDDRGNYRGLDGHGEITSGGRGEASGGTLPSDESEPHSGGFQSLYGTP